VGNKRIGWGGEEMSVNVDMDEKKRSAVDSIPDGRTSKGKGAITRSGVHKRGPASHGYWRSVLLMLC